MFEQMLEMIGELEKNDELFDAMARCMFKMYQSLVKAGFSEAQATQIVAGQGMGIKPS